MVAKTKAPKYIYVVTNIRNEIVIAVRKQTEAREAVGLPGDSLHRYMLHDPPVRS